MATGDEKPQLPTAPLAAARGNRVAKRVRAAAPVAAHAHAPGSSDTALEELLLRVIQRCEAQGGERKQLRSQRRKQEIMRAALRIFAQDGLSRSRIGDIAAEAGMPISTIYEYYSSKEELAYAVPTAELAAFFREFSACVARLPDARSRLRTYLWLAADFARRNPEWARVLYLELWPSVLVSQSPLKDNFDDYVRVILHLIRAGEAAGEWPSGADAYETAALLNGGLNQIIITALLYRRPRNLSGAAASAVDRAMQILDAPRAPKPRRRR